VAKPSLDDCAWVRQKAGDVFEFTSGDKSVEVRSEDDTAHLAALIDLDASRPLLAALAAMTQCGLTVTDNKFSHEHIEAVCLLLKSLRNLARDLQESIALVSSKHATTTIRDTLSMFEHSPSVCRDGCGVLANLAVPFENRIQVFSECSSVVVSCMRRNSSDTKLARNGCAFIMNLANDVHLLQEIGDKLSPILVEVGMIH